MSYKMFILRTTALTPERRSSVLGTGQRKASNSLGLNFLRELTQLRWVVCILSVVSRWRPSGAPHLSRPQAKVCREKEHIPAGVTQASGLGVLRIYLPSHTLEWGIFSSKGHLPG